MTDDDHDNDLPVGDAEQVRWQLRQRLGLLDRIALKQVLRDVIVGVEHRYDRSKAASGITTGLESVDLLVRGLRSGGVTVLAGRPFMGVTSLALSWAVHAAGTARAPILIFSPSQSVAAIGERLVCARSRVDSIRIRGGFLEAAHWKPIAQAASELAELPISIIDHPAPSIDAVCTAVCNWRETTGSSKAHQTGLVVIDDVKWLPNDTRLRDWSEVAWRLKELAVATEVHLLLVGHVSGKADERDDHRPMMRDLRPRGLDRIADLVGFLYRDEVYSKDECAEEDRGIVELIFGQNTYGPTGTVRLRFLNHCLRFESAPADMV